MLKKTAFIFLFPIFFSSFLYAQDIREIYVHLYTDSLKRGTYNYINIDGKLANGKYIPLDSNYLTFSSNHGKFYGNSLFIENNSLFEKVEISVVYNKNPSLHKEFVIWVKSMEDPTPLPTNQEILERIRREQSSNSEKNS